LKRTTYIGIPNLFKLFATDRTVQLIARHHEVLVDENEEKQTNKQKWPKPNYIIKVNEFSNSLTLSSRKQQHTDFSSTASGTLSSSLMSTNSSDTTTSSEVHRGSGMYQWRENAFRVYVSQHEKKRKKKR
jgi:hypothetical protein